MTTYTWTAGTSDWSTAGAWFPAGGPPNSTADSALIAAAGTYVVLISAENVAANTVTLNAAGATLQLDTNGALTLGGPSPTLLVNAGTLTLGGTLVGGTVKLSGGTADLTDGYLYGVTWQGTFALNPFASVYIGSGLTVQTAGGLSPGTIDLTAGFGLLYAIETETFDHAILDFGNIGGNYLQNYAPGSTLTLGSAFRITQSGGDNFLQNVPGDNTIQNNGTVSVLGGNLAVLHGTFRNAGTVSVSSGIANFTFTTLINTGTIGIGTGGLLMLGGDPGAVGSIGIGTGGTLDVTGSATLAQLQAAHITNNAGTVRVDGTLIMGGDTLQVLPTGLFSNVVVGNLGTLANGTVHVNGGTIALEGGGGAGAWLSDITWRGPMALATGVGINVSGSLAVQTTAGLPGTISLSGGANAIWAQGNVTLNNTTLDFGSAGDGQLWNYDLVGAGTTLTLGTSFVLRQSGGNNFVNNYSDNGTIASSGTINVTGGNLGVQTGLFANTGTVLVSGGVIDFSLIALQNSGSLMARAGGTIVLGGTVTGTGSVVIGDGTVAVGGGTDIDITFGNGNGFLQLDYASLYTGTIFNFLDGDAIDLSNVDYQPGGSATLLTGNILHVVEGGTTVDLQLDPLQNFTGKTFQTAPGSTMITVVCFLAGTRIATEDGETLVEDLKAGDRVRTVSGQHRRITWIGTGRHLATPGRRDASTPVIVRRGALADKVPYHDLRITKAHSLFVDGVLIPVEYLVNHRSILWDDRTREVTLYHVELETHDVLLANGAPAESYRDDGNRWLFENANSGWHLPPQPPCAPVLTGGPVVDAAWQRLLDRSGHRPALPLTGDPDLHLSVSGVRIDGSEIAPGAWMFRLPAGPHRHEVRIVSRSAAPQELGLARDPRELGVALRKVAIDNGAAYRIVAADDPVLSAGTHPYEPDQGFRWTTGEAILPPNLFEGFRGPIDIVLHVAHTTRYLAKPRLRRAA